MPETTSSSTQRKKVVKPFNPISSLREHLLLVLTIFISGALLSVVVGAKKSRMTFEAQAVLNVMPTVPKILYSTEDTLRLRSYEDWMRTQINILSSYDVLEEAIQRFQEKGFRWQRPNESMPSAAARLAAKLKIKQIRDTQLITLTLTSSARKGLSDIINDVVESFIASKRTEQEKEDSLKLKRLKEEKAKIQNELDQSYRDLEKVSDIYGTAITEEKNLYVYINALSEMKKAQNNIYLQRIGLENRMDALMKKAEDIRSMELGPMIDEKVENDPILKDNLVQLSRREQDIRTHMVGLRRDNPDYVYYKAMLTSLQEQSRQIRQTTQRREERLIRENMLAENDLAVLDTRSELQAVTDTERQLSEKIKKLQQEVLEFNTAVLRASTKRQNIERLQASLNRVNERMDQITLEWANPGRISVVTWALPPEDGVSNRMKLTAIGILLSLVAGCGLALGMDFLNPVIKRPDDIGKVLGFPATGYIIDADADQVPSSEMYWLFKKYPDSYIYDLFKNIVLRFKKEHRSHGSAVFAVHGLKDGNGASSFCINALAALDANKDRKLYIDLNFRNPLKKRLAFLESRDGLSEWASQTDDNISPFVYSLPELPFEILPAGREESLLPTILPLSRVEGLLENLRPRYDYVFIDGPPMLASSLAAELASISDVTVIVPQAGSSQWGELVFAANLLDRSGVEVVSVIPNRVPILKGGRFHESMKRFYGNRQGSTTESASAQMASLRDFSARFQHRWRDRVRYMRSGKGRRIAFIITGAALLGIGAWYGINRMNRVPARDLTKPGPSTAQGPIPRRAAPDTPKQDKKSEETPAGVNAGGPAPAADTSAVKPDEASRELPEAPAQAESRSSEDGTDAEILPSAPLAHESVDTAGTLPDDQRTSQGQPAHPASDGPHALTPAQKGALAESVLTPGKTSGGYFLQIYSMKTEHSAREALAPFIKSGRTGTVEQVQVKGIGEMFRVLIGPFASRAAAVEARKEPEPASDHPPNGQGS